MVRQGQGRLEGTKTKGKTCDVTEGMAGKIRLVSWDGDGELKPSG